MILTTVTQRCAMGLLLPLRGTPQLLRLYPPPLFDPPLQRSQRLIRLAVRPPCLQTLSQLAAESQFTNVMELKFRLRLYHCR
jgi:hypothetical protein